MRPFSPATVLVLAAAAGFAAAPGCGLPAPAGVPASDEPVLLRRDLPAAAAPASAAPDAPAGPAAPATLTLARALEIAEAENPALRALEADIGAARGRERQAGLWPNPEAFFETTDGVLYREPREAKYVWGLAYTVPIGGRVGAAEAVAAKDREAAEAALDVARRALRAEVKVAFATVLFQAALVELTKRVDWTAGEVREMAVARVKAGTGTEAEQHKVEVVQVRLDLELKQAESELAGARLRLARTLGRATAELPPLEGTLEGAVAPLPDLEAVRERAIREHPQIALALRRFDQARADLGLARQERIPDVTLFVAAATTPDLRDESETAIEAGVSVPVPIVDRKQGRLEEAEAAVRRGAREAEAAANDLLHEVADAHRRAAIARETVRSYREIILPDARDALERARKEYDAGRFNIIDLLDGYRTMTEDETGYVQALLDLAIAEADLARAAGE